MSFKKLFKHLLNFLSSLLRDELNDGEQGELEGIIGRPNDRPKYK